MDQLRLVLTGLLFGATDRCDVPGIDVDVTELPDGGQQDRVDLIAEVVLPSPAPSPASRAATISVAQSGGRA